jgi:hypothetical protein
MTQRLPSASLQMRAPIRCRSRRLTRFRVTAGPTLRPTTKPIRVGVEPEVPTADDSGSSIGRSVLDRRSGGRQTWATTVRCPARRPALTASRNSRDRRRRRGWGNTSSSTGQRQRSRSRPALKQPAGYGPCADERPGSPGRPGCASGDGSRASCGDAGCSAGTYACSREGSQVGCDEKDRIGDASRASWLRHPDDSGQPRSADSDRLINGTLPVAAGQTDGFGGMPSSPWNIQPYIWASTSILLWTTGCARPAAVVSVQPTPRCFPWK